MTWDYTDDFGATVADGAYRVVVIAHNVAYQWQGVIGNTSNRGAAALVQRTMTFGGTPTVVDTVGEHTFRAFSTISTMAIGPDGVGYIANSYNEQQHAMARFNVAAPQEKTLLSHDDFQRVFKHVVTDGTIAYFANTGLGGAGAGIFDHAENFIIGLHAGDGAEVTFPGGSQWRDGIGPGNWWDSVLDPVDEVSAAGDPIQGMAVETTGSNLYVSHRTSGIKIIHKTTGACRNTTSPYAGNCGGSIAVPNPSVMAMAPNGDLWVASNGTEVRRYTTPGDTPSLAATVSGFSRIIAVAVSPVTSTLLVVDAGVTEQRIKAYDTTTGALKWVHGALGGYNSANGSLVTPTKLKFDDADVSYITFEPAAGGREVFWVGEPGNLRNLKFEIPGTPTAVNPLIYRDVIMYLPASYSMTADRADPSRVFSGFLEFHVDHSRVLHESWTLTRNWNIELPEYYRDHLQKGFHDVFTTPQGRTYGVVSGADHNRPNVVVELAPEGVRDTGITLAFGARFHENMSVRYAKKTSVLYEIYQRDFTGIDGAGNPIFSAESVVASAPLRNPVNVKNPFRDHCASSAQEEFFPKTSTGIIITFDPCAVANPQEGYDPTWHHLGGIAPGGTDYTFRASPGGSFTLQPNKGDSLVLDGDGTFNLADLAQNYAGSRAMSAGRHIVYNYFGEFWNAGQANQWMHWLDNGLFIGQFGIPNYPGLNRFSPIAGAAGNTFSPIMLEVDGSIYIYHNDESVHAGVHRWRLQNLNSIQQMTGSVGKNTAVTNANPIISTALDP